MIQIDMDMPRNCCECPFRSVQNNFACSAIETFMNTAAYTNKRPEWCPLHFENKNEKTTLERVKDIFDDFSSYSGCYPCNVIVTEKVLQMMEDEVRGNFNIPNMSHVIPKYCGVPIKTVNDNEIVLTTDSGYTIKYSLKGVKQE